MNRYLSGYMLVLCILTAIGKDLHAADHPPVTYLGIEQGLSNNAVTCIYQDHNGFMWFGTYDGLNRYDGYNFNVYRNQFNDTGSLINNRIACITEDQDQRLWIGTRRGISIFDNTSSRFQTLYYLPYKATTGKKLAVPVTAIQPGVAAHVFIGTSGEGLLIYNKVNDRTVQAPLLTDTGLTARYDVMSVKTGADRQVWLFVRNVGLCRYNYSTGAINIINNSIKNGITLQADHSSNLWLGADDGLYQYHPASNTFTAVLSTNYNRVVHLTVDKHNNLWIASDGEGVFVRSAATGQITHLTSSANKELLTSMAVYAIYEDREDRKWIGTLRGGINIIDPKKTQFSSITHDPLNPNSLINDFILSLNEDPDHNIWIGTDGGGLSYWNRQQRSWLNFRHQHGNNRSLSSNFVTGIVTDYQHNTWITTWGGGINRYNKATQTFEHFTCFNPVSNAEDKNTWLLYEDATKKLWAGACNDGQLYWLNRSSNRFEVFDNRLTNMLVVAEDSSGNFWGGNYTSLIKIDRLHKQHQVYNIGHAVRAIHEDKTHHFWIGTEGGGLLLFNRENGQYTRFTKSEGLSNNSILKILEDKQGNLWISTFSGISKFNPQKKTFQNFSRSDGLQSNQFNYNAALALQSGEFIFGGIKGFNIFYPDSIKHYASRPALLLTGLKVSNVPIEQDASFITQRTRDHIQALRVPYNKAVIAVDFVALEYSAPDKIDYAYYLEGWDKDWNYVGKARTANYTRLHEGNYTLRIKATNAEGVWNNREYTLKITVLPPWYRTWWAYALYVSVIVLLFYGYMQYKAQQARQAFDIRLARLETEKEKELNEKKLSFFTNISHEFRTPLTLIINPVKELLLHNDTTPHHNSLDIVYRNARRLLSLVDQLMLFRKADSETDKLKISRLNFHHVCREVYLCFSQQASAKNISYEFKFPNQQLELYADREKMEIVLFNLLSNALKFTPDGGTVLFEVAEKENHIAITITDTGCGISADTGAKLFGKFYQVKEKQASAKTGFGIGLYLVKHFIENHKGSISYTSVVDKGSTFLVQLRKGHQHFAGHYIFEEIAERPVFLEELTGNIDAGMPLIPGKTAKGQGGMGEFVSDKKSILLVDDNPEIRQYLQQVFQDRFMLYEADNGTDGWQLAREHIPDIIISDILMQGETGVELCSRIKQDPALSHIPVILLTASASEEVKLKGIECGAEDYITKPFEKAFLVARINNILKSRNVLQDYFFDKITLKKNNAKISAEYKDFLEKCIRIVEENLDNEDFNIKTLATQIGMSHSNLYKKVKSISGHSVNAFIRFIRLRRAAVLLLSTSQNVNETAFQVGINDIKYFREQFHKLFEMNPSAYIKKYRGSFNKDFNVVNWSA